MGREQLTNHEYVLISILSVIAIAGSELSYHTSFAIQLTRAT